MCKTCGCGADHHHDHDHDHDHHHHHDHEQESRTVEVGKAVLSENDRLAMENRLFLDSKDVVGLNFLSSPGSGKTQLLVETANRIKDTVPMAVLEGDCQTDYDAQRIAKTGVPVHQITTGGVCHLDAHMVAHGFEHIDLKPNSLLFIENVGNLVCPADFLLGEQETVVVLSVTEGDDKPAKYPAAFNCASVLVFTKLDLLPYVDFDIDRAIRFALTVNPKLKIFRTSAKSGEGMDEWCEWLKKQARA